MTRRRTAYLAFLAAALVGGAAEAQEPTRPMVISSDPELAALAESLLPELADRSGLELTEPVRLERRSREHLVEYLQVKLNEELPDDEARAVVDAYALLGLVPSDLDLRSVLLALYTEQVAGFYEPDSTALFVMDDQEQADMEALLIHELVHAIQDQSADLAALTGPEVGSDRAMAAQAAIEGHATLVMMEFMAEQMMGMRLDLAMMPDFAEQLRPALDAMRSQFPALAGAPRVIQESLLFPYLEGAAFVQALWTSGRRIAPFGEYLPLSSEQVMDRDVTDAPVELTLDVGGGTMVDDDVLGLLSVDILLDELVGVDAEGIAEGWEGDRYALVEVADGTRGLVWVVVWEDSSTRDRFVSAVTGARDRLGGPATVERLEVAGAPAALVRVGPVQDVTVDVQVADAP